MSVLTKEDADVLIARSLPDYWIQAGPVEYEDLWLYSMASDDPLEGQMDVFYSINRSTGAFSGFSILDNPGKFIGLFDENATHSDMLAHYGVKGMRWGVTKSYTSVSSSKSNSEKNHGPAAVSVAMELGLNMVKPMLGRFVPSASPSNHAAKIAIETFAKSPKAMMVSKAVLSKIALDKKVSIDTVKFAVNAKPTLSTLAFKTALKTELTSPLAIAGYGISALDSGAYRVPVVAVQNKLRGGWPKDASLSTRNMSLTAIKKKVVTGVNRDFPGLGTTNNCVRATYAYEMRRRGFDVAATKTIMATGQGTVGRAVVVGTLRDRQHKIASTTKHNPISSLVFGDRPSAVDVMNTLSTQPDRSRGELVLTWGPGKGGHSVAYEIIDGSPVIIDSQSGKTYSSAAAFSQMTAHAAGVSYTRLDNKPLNQVALTAFLKDGAV